LLKLDDVIPAVEMIVLMSSKYDTAHKTMMSRTTPSFHNSNRSYEREQQQPYSSRRRKVSWISLTRRIYDLLSSNRSRRCVSTT
jgi:hypothetical protein